MPNQENPNITFVNVRLTQQLLVKAKRLARQRGFRGGVAELARHLLQEECINVELTPEDCDEIKRRIAHRRKVIAKQEGRDA